MNTTKRDNAFLERCETCKWSYNGPTGIKQTGTYFYWGRTHNDVKRIFQNRCVDCYKYEAVKRK
jgi:hypothetical protein